MAFSPFVWQISLFRLFAFPRGVFSLFRLFAWHFSTFKWRYFAWYFRLFEWHFFVCLCGRFRFFVFSPGVLSSFCFFRYSVFSRGIFRFFAAPNRQAKRRNNEMAQTSYPTLPIRVHHITNFHTYFFIGGF